MRCKIGVIVATLFVGASVLTRAQTAAPSLQGVWRVTEVVVTGANAATNKTPQPGLYVFTKQHYSIVTVNGTAPRNDFGTPNDPSKLTDAEKLARYEAWAPFAANSGTYQVSGSTLTTRPLVAKNPAVMRRQGPVARKSAKDTFMRQTGYPHGRKGCVVGKLLNGRTPPGLPPIPHETQGTGISVLVPHGTVENPAVLPRMYHVPVLGR